MNWKFFRGNRDAQHDEIPNRIKAYDKTGDKRVSHVRVDDATLLLLNHLKMATGVEIQRIAPSPLVS